MILRKHRLWHLLAPDFHPMPERSDVGRALSTEEVDKIIEAAIASRSCSLFPALMTYCVFRSMWAGDSIPSGPLIPV